MHVVPPQPQTEKKNIWLKHCLQFLLGTTVIPREIEHNAKCRSLDVNKLHCSLWENCELGTFIKNDNDCNENMNNKGIRDYLKLLLAVSAIIVHALD